MSVYTEAPPMELGETLSGKDADSNLINADKLGMIYDFPAIVYTGNVSGNKTRLTGKRIRAILLRNTSGFALLPKRVVQLDKTAGYDLCKNATGYTATHGATLAVIVDPNLPAAGVADDDIFWAIIGGPTTVMTSVATLLAVIAVGDPIVSAVGSTSGNSTNGRVTNVTINSSTANTEPFTMSLAMLGYALSAKTSDNTSADLLIDACIRL